MSTPVTRPWRRASKGLHLGTFARLLDEPEPSQLVRELVRNKEWRLRHLRFDVGGDYHVNADGEVNVMLADFPERTPADSSAPFDEADQVP